MVSDRDATTETFLPPRRRERRAVKAAAALSAVVLAVLGFASYKVAETGRPGKPATAQRAAAVASASSRQPATPSATPATPSAPSAPSASPSPSPSPAAPRAIKPVSAAAFGPGGTSDGDGSAQAEFAIDASMTTDWRTDWYASPRFGNLQPGTGLLIDMGQAVTVNSVDVTLGGISGADLEIRAGNTPTPASLTQVAGASDAGGAVRLKLARPVRARYVLLWFTSLPRDGAGTYQVQVYNVSVTGRP